MSKEAMKLALEALEGLEALLLSMGLTHLIVYGDAEKAITNLQKQLEEQPAQQALDKMAENARELGIQMQPEEPRAWFTVDELNAWADKKLKENPQWAEQPAQQEPVAWPCLIAEADFSQDTVTLAMQCTDYKVSAGNHWLSNTPPAQRTWVGLTDEEIKQAMDYWSSDEHSAYGGAASAAGEYFDVETSWRYIEAKLKEKNT